MRVIIQSAILKLSPKRKTGNAHLGPWLMWVPMESWFYPAIFAMNTQPVFPFWKPASKPQSLELTGKKPRTAKNAAFTVTWSLLWCFRGIFELTPIGLSELASEMGMNSHFLFELDADA